MFVAFFSMPAAPLPTSGPDDPSSPVKNARWKGLVRRRMMWDIFCTVCIRLGTLGSFLYFFYLMIELGQDWAKTAVKFRRR